VLNDKWGGMAEFLKGAAWGLAALLVLAQFLRPARSNPPVIPGHTLQDVVAVPPTVQTILTRACDDCHSDLTRWPWYSQVAPISWFLADHVHEGRRHLNVSEWVPGIGNPATYTGERFRSACREVRSRDMPLWSYLLIHRNAYLSPDDIQTICSWAATLSDH
jgi:hypothetical protein